MPPIVPDHQRQNQRNFRHFCLMLCDNVKQKYYGDISSAWIRSAHGGDVFADLFARDFCGQREGGVDWGGR
jgi:hypothetical protein